MKASITVTLDDEEVLKILTREIENKFNMSVKSITSNIQTTTRGYGPGEYEDHIFTGVTAQLEKKEDHRTQGGKKI